MPGLVEPSQVGKREDLRDFISIVDMKDKPLLAVLGKLPDQKNMLVSWQADAYATPISTGIADGVDVDSFENSAGSRALVSMYGQKFRRTAMVGDLAENVSNVAGASAGELARAIDKKLEEIARDIEFAMGGDQEAQAESSSAAPYKFRGFGKWAQSTAQAVLPVNANFLTPANSILTGLGGTGITEAQFRVILTSVFNQYGKRRNLNLVCGTFIKQAVTNFTATAGGASTVQRTYNADLSEHTVITNITLYEGDFNTVEVSTSLLVGGVTDPTSTTMTQRSYIFNSEIAGICYNRPPRVMKLPDLGGGPRALVDAICCLVVKNPLAIGKTAV